MPFPWSRLPLEVKHMIITHILHLCFRHRSAGLLFRILKALALVSSTFVRDDLLPPLLRFKRHFLNDTPAPALEVLKQLHPTKGTITLRKITVPWPIGTPVPTPQFKKHGDAFALVRMSRKWQVLNQFAGKMEGQVVRHFMGQSNGHPSDDRVECDQPGRHDGT